MTTHEFRAYYGDLTGAWKGPVPFLDENKKRIGEVVSVRFDGQFTVATVHMDSDAWDAISRFRQVGVELWREPDVVMAAVGTNPVIRSEIG